MKRICVVGAGQLGSRHLQALRNVDEPLHIQVIDPSPESLRIARERFEAIAPRSRYEVTYGEGFDGVSGPIDVAVVATTCTVRRRVIETLLARTEVKSFILEKLLFPRREDYAAVGELLRTRGSRAWVNCSMRVMPFYAALARDLIGHPVDYRVSGSRFGLVTNAIHYVDHAASLAGCTRFVVRTQGLHPKPVPSKRAGYLELDGTLRVEYEDGSSCTMTCHSSGDAPILVEIHGERLRCISRESEGKAWLGRASAGWRWHEVEARVPYQSEMTSAIVKELLESATCSLAPYEESAQIHLALLEPLRTFLETCGSLEADDFPFT